ncbi:E1 ubiquitin-activating protein aos1 [Oleoguttula sp. CCFEE 5521]
MSNGNTGATNGDMVTETQANGLSADDFALYDRQIRLWGAKAQEQIRNANVLLISLRALGTEIAKNLTLAGIRSLTVIDDNPVLEEDLGAGHFLRDTDVGKSRAEAAIPRIQDLNPRVTVASGGSLAELMTKDQNYYAAFSVIVACDHDFTTLNVINTGARVAQRPFYAASIHGMYGFVFADLVLHDYVIEREQSNMPTTIRPESLTRSVMSTSSKKEPTGRPTEIVQKREIYCPLLLANSSPLPKDILSNRRKLKAVPALLPCIRALFDFQRTFARLPDHTPQDAASFISLAKNKAGELQLPVETLTGDFIKSFMQNIGAEIITTAAFVGGRLSEDVLKVLGQREQPIQNFALFDFETLVSPIYCLYSPPPELVMPALNGHVGLLNGSDAVAAPVMGSAVSAAEVLELD